MQYRVRPLLALIIVAVLFASVSIADKRREGAAVGGDFCADDPQGGSWTDHLLGVITGEACTSPSCLTTYTLGGTGIDYMVAGGDSTWTRTGALDVTVAASSDATHADNSVGFDSGTSGGSDYLIASTGEDIMIPIDIGRLGFSLKISDGASGNCDVNDTVGIWGDAGAFTMWMNITGNEASGWSLTLFFDQAAGSTVSTTCVDCLVEDTWTFIEFEWDTTANRLNIWHDGISGTARTAALLDRVASTRLRLGKYQDCVVDVDDVWMSSDSTWDIFNYVSGGDDTVGDGNECYAPPI